MGCTPYPTKATRSSTPSSQRTQGDQEWARTTSLETVLTTTGRLQLPLVFFPTCVRQMWISSHTTPNFPQGQSQHQPSQAAIQQSHNASTRNSIMYPPTPIKISRLSKLLWHHPDSEKVQYIIQGLQRGFDLEYSGPFEPRTLDNLSTAAQDPQLIKTNF